MWCKSCTQWTKGGFRCRQAIQRWVMTLGAISVFLFLVQCQQGYPTTATLCDEWCAAHDRTRCANEDPAECIVWCERRRAIDVENGGPPGRCDGSRRAVMDCVDMLPDSVFDCTGPSRVRVDQSCQRETLVLSICETKQMASWPAVCNHWALQCTSSSRQDGGDSSDRLYESCLPPTDRFSCFEEPQILVDCVAAQALSCHVLPAENAACERERLALDSCHLLLRPLCAQWSDACSMLDVVADGGPLDGAPHSLASCLAARPVGAGARCKRELDALYSCFWNTPENRGQRCDVVPLLAPECHAENEVFTACARSSDGEAFVP